MAARIVEIDDDRFERAGIGRITAPFFYPDHQVVRILCIQPQSVVAASISGFELLGIDHTEKFRSFLSLAVGRDIDIALAPEYSFPWSVLDDALRQETFPGRNSIWLLGCQSTTWDAVQTFIRAHPTIHWIIEDGPLPGDKFLDPTCYFFSTENGRVGIVQFKSESCGDGGLHLERDHLAAGNQLYILRKDTNSIHVSAISCSDALSETWIDHVSRQFNSPFFLFHPQLNEEPRHTRYSAYRKTLFANGSNEKEIFTLNWARGTIVKVPSIEQDFAFNLPLSAIYSQSKGLDLGDDRISTNHDRGLYLTRWVKHYAGTFVLNFNEGVFLIETTKCHLKKSDKQ